MKTQTKRSYQQKPTAPPPLETFLVHSTLMIYMGFSSIKTLADINLSEAETRLLMDQRFLRS